MSNLDIFLINKMDRKITKDSAKEIFGDKWEKNCTGIHESTLRAYHILGRVKYLLEKKCPSDVILEFIEEMEMGG